MFYPTLHLNYENSGTPVIIVVDSESGEQCFGATMESLEETTSLFMDMLMTYVAQADMFYEKGWYQGFDDGLLENEENEKNRGTD